MKRAVIALGTVCVLMIGLLLTGCSRDRDSKQENAAVPDGQPVQEEHAEEIVIDTEYGDLYYPAQWEEFLQLDQSKSDGCVQVAFSGKIDEALYPLFTITIGDADGASAGTLTGEDGIQRTVYVQIAEVTENAPLSQSELNRLYAMQEDLNYLIDNLK